MVVGFQVAFKENWESIMLGIESMAMSKEQLGAQFGKMIPKELWPSACIPDRLFYDGGKLDQHNTSGIVAMNVDAQTGIPYTVVRPTNWPGRYVRILPQGGSNEDQSAYGRTDHQDS
jgi:hypothetical protein